MVFIVNDQISVIITGLPSIYVNVWHVTIVEDLTFKKIQDSQISLEVPRKEIACNKSQLNLYFRVLASHFGLL